MRGPAEGDRPMLVAVPEREPELGMAGALKLVERTDGAGTELETG